MTVFRIIILIPIYSLIMSCGGDDGSIANNCSNATFQSQFQDNIDEVASASLTYGMNPTTASCNTFKNAYINFINELEDWEDCARVANQLSEWRMSLDAAKDAAEAISC